jgi:predicted nucleic acid-binding protein
VILLDTTVLVYAAGRDHPLRDPCQRLLEAHARRAVRCTTTVEVVQEFTHIYGRSRTRPDATAVARRYLAAFDLLPSTPADLALGLQLYEAHERLGAFDAVLAAVALNHGVEALVSADRDFAVVPDLHWIDPRSAVTPPS